MKKEIITEVTLDEARELYNSNNKILKELALKCFPENELSENYFTKIKSFEDAVNVLGMDIDETNSIVCLIKKKSKSSAAMFKLNIIRKSLNLGYDLRLTKNPINSYIYCPNNELITKNSVYYKEGLNSGDIEIIGSVNCEEIEFYVLCGNTYYSTFDGLCDFFHGVGVSYSTSIIGYLGCANEKIAKHFGKYFGMLIPEAKYGDSDDFEIIEDKYGNS